MEKDEERDDKPITDGLSPQDDPTTIAAAKLFVPDPEIQKTIENATEGDEPQADHKDPNPAIDDGGYRKVDKGARTKEDISVILKNLVHHVLSSDAPVDA